MTSLVMGPTQLTEPPSVVRVAWPYEQLASTFLFGDALMGLS
jgi:hypothetical protein